MYIKYLDDLQRPNVRDVKHFALRNSECEEEDRFITEGAELFDAGYEERGGFADACVEYACGLLLGGMDEVDKVRYRRGNRDGSVTHIYECYNPGVTSLHWFNCFEAAEQVLDELCGALASGRQFFDLTIYDESGRVRE